MGMDAQSERQERAHGRAAEARVRHAQTRAGPAAAGDKAQGLRAAGRRREQRLGGLAGCLRFKFQPKRSHRNSARTNVQLTLVAWAQAASGLPGTDVLLRAERGQGSPTLNSCTESTGNSDLNKMPKMFGCSQIHQLQNCCFSRKKKNRGSGPPEILPLAEETGRPSAARRASLVHLPPAGKGAVVHSAVPGSITAGLDASPRPPCPCSVDEALKTSLDFLI